MPDEPPAPPDPSAATSPGRGGELDELRAERARFRAIMDGSSDMVILVDGDGSPTYLSPAVRTVMGFEPDDLIESNPLELIHPDDQDAMTNRILVFDTDEKISGAALVRVRHRGGGWRWLEVLATNKLHEPDVAAIVVNARDMTERVEAEQALAVEKQRYQLLVEAIPDVVARFDRELALQFLNPAAEQLLAGRSTGSGPSVDWPAESLTRGDDALRAVSEDGQARTFEVRVVVDGEDLWYETRAVPQLDAEGAIETITTISHDVTARKQHEENLSRQVLEDSLTGLANRAGFELGLEHLLSRRDALTAVLYLDLDHFKHINDTRGHAAGDDFLRGVAVRLRRVTRPSDLVARLGGDEFAVAPDGVADPGDVLALADRIHHALRELTYDDDGKRIGSASIGIAMTGAPAPRVPGQELVRRADAAMYEAKQLGRERTALYEPPAAQPGH